MKIKVRAYAKLNLFLDITGRLPSGRHSLNIATQSVDIYDDITSLAFAWSLANPSDEATAFIRNVNALISDAQTAYNQRMGQKKKKESDRPEIE